MLTLHVDEARWQQHLERVRDADPSVVPVAKGNGYGLGLPRLAETAQSLGLDTLAVGTYAEVPVVERHFDGSLLVLSPWRPFETRATYDPRLIHTVGRVSDVEDLTSDPSRGRPRVALELLTSMRRHGFTPAELRAVAPLVDRLQVEGFALHLPMDHGSHLGEVERLFNDIVASGIDARTVWISHLAAADMTRLRASYGDFDVRPRTGTGLWLGDRGALRVTSSVLDVHPVRRGDVYGYRGRSAPRAGHILVVSGGTAHGIGLEAPTGGTSLRDRAARVAKGGLDAAGFVRSPFTVTGKQRLFAEPPHMQASMLFLPLGAEMPAIGDQVDVAVRFTATAFDQTLPT